MSQDKSEFVITDENRLQKFFSKLDPYNYRLTVWIFLRALGVIYLIAFASLSVQIKGLVGSNGILPIAPAMENALTRLTFSEAIRRFPSLVWFNTSDAFLMGLCLAGMIFSILLILNISPKLSCFSLWLLYLSMVNAGQVFLSFQWDNLLIEVGFLAIFLAPIWENPRTIGTHQPSKIVVWLFRWVLFRLMFASGMVKILSGDATWTNFSAMTYHYETQPLPTPLSWYVHNLPLWFHQFSTMMVFVFELVIPFCFVLLRPLRIIGAIATIGFQVLILLTGNYTFFNWLTIVLCLLLLDDKSLLRMIPTQMKNLLVEDPKIQQRWQHILYGIFGAFMFVISLFVILQQLAILRPMPAPIQSVNQQIRPFRIINTYGLFAVMTTDRPQIIIEGSYDGEEWLAYELRWQPQDLDKMPAFVAPHQPRLDWQLWFAALGNIDNNRWFMSFVQRLQDGSPDVLGLIKHSPFPVDNPPTYIRAQVFNYTFTAPAEKRETGNWWNREFVRDYVPILEASQK